VTGCAVITVGRARLRPRAGTLPGPARLRSLELSIQKTECEAFWAVALQRAFGPESAAIDLQFHSNATRAIAVPQNGGLWSAG
jgi:hypothetical protein